MCCLKNDNKSNKLNEALRVSAYNVIDIEAGNLF